MPKPILFLIRKDRVVIITSAVDRQQAKQNAVTWVGGNPDSYEVTPLTKEGDAVKLDIYSI